MGKGDLGASRLACDSSCSAAFFRLNGSWDSSSGPGWMQSIYSAGIEELYCSVPDQRWINTAETEQTRLDVDFLEGGLN